MTESEVNEFIRTYNEDALDLAENLERESE